MKRIHLYLIALMLLFTAIPSYSFRFFGVDISGTLDEVTENLKSIGFSPVMVTPKTGEFAGHEIVFGNDSIRTLKGDILGHQVYLDISTDNSKLVDSAIIQYKNNNSKFSNEFAAKLFEYLSDRYGLPEPIIIKKQLSEKELSEIKSLYGDDVPDMIGIWEFKNMMITLQSYFSTGIVTCSYSNKNIQE